MVYPILANNKISNFYKTCNIYKTLYLFCRESEMIQNTWSTSFKIMNSLPRMGYTIGIVCCYYTKAWYSIGIVRCCEMNYTLY